MLRRAQAQPRDLVIGLDAVAAAMAEASRHAPANAVFVVGAAEWLPGPLRGRADLVTVALPWGSLLRAVTEPVEPALRAIVACLKPSGKLELLLADLDPDVLVADYAAAGFQLLECRPATADDVARLSSSWAKRLGIPSRRSASLFRFATPRLQRQLSK